MKDKKKKARCHFVGCVFVFLLFEKRSQCGQGDASSIRRSATPTHIPHPNHPLQVPNDVAKATLGEEPKPDKDCLCAWSGWVAVWVGGWVAGDVFVCVCVCVPAGCGGAGGGEVRWG